MTWKSKRSDGGSLTWSSTQSILTTRSLARGSRAKLSRSDFTMLVAPSLEMPNPGKFGQTTNSITTHLISMPIRVGSRRLNLTLASRSNLLMEKPSPKLTSDGATLNSRVKKWELTFSQMTGWWAWINSWSLRSKTLSCGSCNPCLTWDSLQWPTLLCKP